MLMLRHTGWENTWIHTGIPSSPSRGTKKDELRNIQWLSRCKVWPQAGTTFERSKKKEKKKKKRKKKKQYKTAGCLNQFNCTNPSAFILMQLQIINIRILESFVFISKRYIETDIMFSPPRIPFFISKTLHRDRYSRLSLSRMPMDSLKYFEISVFPHIRFAELRRN